MYVLVHMNMYVYQHYWYVCMCICLWHNTIGMCVCVWVVVCVWVCIGPYGRPAYVHTTGVRRAVYGLSRPT